MSELAVTGVRAHHGRVEVLRGVDLHVPQATVVAVLGSSGCGKTTLLRALAGHHPVTEGRIRLGEHEIVGPGVHVPPEHRSIGLVPQEGALFPHLSVRDNVAFGLRERSTLGLRRTPDADARVRRMLALVGLDGLERRRPHQLSGGQQQRVALARALAPAPRALLLDEPFSALDARVRESVRADVRAVLEREGCTAVLVTHDRTEAFTMADSVAVMVDGVVVQQGSPQEIYRTPVDRTTAQLTGPTLILDVETDTDTEAGVATGSTAPVVGRPVTVAVSMSMSTVTTSAVTVSTALGPVEAHGQGRHLMLRPEQVRLRAHGVDAVVTAVAFGGGSTDLRIRLADGSEHPMSITGLAPAVGERVQVGVDGPGWLLPD